jgi:hypothetical protein
MYHRRIATAFVFIVLFTAIEVIFAMAAWKMFGKNLWDKLHQIFSTDELAVSEKDELTAAGSSTASDEHETNHDQTEDDNDDDYLTED